MDAENTQNETSEASEEKGRKKNKDSKNSERFSISDWIAAHRAEFKKITWPSRRVLAKETVTVIIISLFVGAVIFCYDEALSFLFSKFVGLF